MNVCKYNIRISESSSLTPEQKLQLYAYKIYFGIAERLEAIKRVTSFWNCENIVRECVDFPVKRKTVSIDGRHVIHECLGGPGFDVDIFCYNNNNDGSKCGCSMVGRDWERNEEEGDNQK